MAILAPPRRVHPDRLQMPVGIGTDQHLLPRRWDREAPDAVEVRAIFHGVTTRTHVGELDRAVGAGSTRHLDEPA